MADSRNRKRKKTSQAAEIWKRLQKNRMAMAGLCTLIVILLLSLFGPLLSPYDYAAQNFTDRLMFPCASHLFGTDNFGRDILTRILVGGRYTLFITFVCITSAAIMGSALGLLAAFYPKMDNIIRYSDGNSYHADVCQHRGGFGQQYEKYDDCPGGDPVSGVCPHYEGAGAHH